MDQRTLKLDLLEWLANVNDLRILERINKIQQDSREITTEEKKMLDERIKEYRANPHAGSPIDEVEARLRAKHGL